MNTLKNKIVYVIIFFITNVCFAQNIWVYKSTKPKSSNKKQNSWSDLTPEEKALGFTTYTSVIDEPSKFFLYQKGDTIISTFSFLAQSKFLKGRSYCNSINDTFFIKHINKDSVIVHNNKEIGQVKITSDSLLVINFYYSNRLMYYKQQKTAMQKDKLDLVVKFLKKYKWFWVKDNQVKKFESEFYLNWDSIKIAHRPYHYKEKKHKYISLKTSYLRTIFKKYNNNIFFVENENINIIHITDKKYKYKKIKQSYSFVFFQYHNSFFMTLNSIEKEYTKEDRDKAPSNHSVVELVFEVIDIDYRNKKITLQPYQLDSFFNIISPETKIFLYGH